MFGLDDRKRDVAKDYDDQQCKLSSSDMLNVRWEDFLEYIEIETPKEFSFNQCLVYLDQSDLESVHKVKDGECRLYNTQMLSDK